MARDPGSLWTPLREWNDQGAYAKDKFIVHSTGTRASAAANYAYFNRPAVEVESTFIVGLGPDDPTRQVLDSAARADANVAANRSAIAVEVVGTGDDPFTPWQIDELIRLGHFAHEAHRIPLQVIKTPTGAGYGWHVMFGAPGPWTDVVGKVCPGATRTRQLTDHIFPAIFAGPQEDLMAKLDPDDYKAIAAAVWSYSLGATKGGTTEDPVSIGSESAKDRVNAIRRGVLGVRDRLPKPVADTPAA